MLRSDRRSYGETLAGSDAELVTRIGAGDAEAFALLMRRHARRLFRCVRAVVRDDAEAEDACQEAWLRAYRHLRDLQDGAMFGRWLVRIAMRGALARSQETRGVVSLDELDQAPANDEGPESRCDDRRLARRVAGAIDQLLPSYRDVLVMRDVESMTTPEVAALLGVTQQNVRVRLHRARASLRRRLRAA
ncbi:MAG TPA: sigma-70 family RNA polymerase sigma factor [Nannocystaceae bacterium]|nr:sigma-70 family RNA polymerase sigma factor [Nannocystaceae bacterium]